MVSGYASTAETGRVPTAVVHKPAKVSVGRSSAVLDISGATAHDTYMTNTETTSRLFVWTVEGDPCAGTLDQYARACEQCHYNGLDLGPLYVVHNVRPMALVEASGIDRSSYSSDDYLYVTLTDTVACYETGYKIDLRA